MYNYEGAQFHMAVGSNYNVYNYNNIMSYEEFLHKC